MTPMKTDPRWKDPRNMFGIGQLPDGTVKVYTPEEARAEARKRNSEEEAIEYAMSGLGPAPAERDEDDISDLDDYDDLLLKPAAEDEYEPFRKRLRDGGMGEDEIEKAVQMARDGLFDNG
jgi:hypothetical protein